MNFLGSLAKITVGILTSLGILAAPAANFGSVIPQTPALYQGYLASGIGTSDTSMTLSTGKDNSGNTLAGYYCFTVDVNTPSVEYMCGTASGTAVTALSRGIDVSNPNATSSANAYTHNRFASVQITDYPSLQFVQRQLNGIDSIGATLSYTSHPTSTASTTIIDKNYADNLAIAGAPAATGTTPGIVMTATSSQTAIGQATSTNGSSTYNLVPLNSTFSASSSATTTYQVPVAVSGNITSTWINGDSPNFQNVNVSGTLTSVGTTTLPTSTTINGVNVYNNISNGPVHFIASTTLSANSTTLSLSGLASTTYLHIVAYTPLFISSNQTITRFNGDAGNNYSYSYFNNSNGGTAGAASTTATSNFIPNASASGTAATYIIDFGNNSLGNKLVQFFFANGNTATGPVFTQGIGVWASSTAVSSVAISGTGLFTTSSYIEAFGY